MAINGILWDFKPYFKVEEANAGDSLKDYWSDLKLAFPNPNEIKILAGSRCKIATYYIIFETDELISLPVSSTENIIYYANIKMDRTTQTVSLTYSTDFKNTAVSSDIYEKSILSLFNYATTTNTSYAHEIYGRKEEKVLWEGSSKFGSDLTINLGVDLRYLQSLVFYSKSGSDPIISTSTKIRVSELSENAFFGFTMTSVASTSSTTTFNKYVKKAGFDSIQGSDINTETGSNPITKIIGIYRKDYLI